MEKLARPLDDSGGDWQGIFHFDIFPLIIGKLQVTYSLVLPPTEPNNRMTTSGTFPLFTRVRFGVPRLSSR